MHRRRIRSIAALSAASLVAQPLIAMPSATEMAAAQACPVSAAVEAVPSPNVSPAMLVPFTILPVSLVPISALSPAAIETQRSAITEIMIELGEDEDRARQMATELTAEDLAVLLANPKMMQKAGNLTVIIVALVIVGVIVALALAADSGTVIVNA